MLAPLVLFVVRAVRSGWDLEVLLKFLERHEYIECFLSNDFAVDAR